jgi:hypothetical protein
MVRRLTREFEAEAEANSHAARGRRPFDELGNQPARERKLALSDVTGLTNAVESPVKPEQPRHWGYTGGDGIKESEGVLL